MENEIHRRDTISEFSDDLLLKIVSFPPSKNSIATSVLSKRWRSLWKEVKIFRYDGEYISRFYWKFSRFISTRSSVETLQLKLNPNIMDIDVKPLVNIAAARSLRELRIEMGYDGFKLPQGLSISPQLETIILEKLNLVDVPSNVCLNVKRFYLLSVKFSRDESVETLLSICPRLEDLVVRRSSYTNVRIFTIRMPTLRRLSIDYSSGTSRPKGVHGFVINAPSLRCFSIRAGFSNILRFEDMPELVKASVSVVCDQPDKFLGSLASTLYLSLCSVTSQEHFLRFLDHFELCLCTVEWWNLLTRMLIDAPRLRVLKLKLYQKHCFQYNEAMDPWNQPDSAPACLSSHLEIFEWKQYIATEQESEVAKYILVNASCLKEATFYSESANKHGMLKELECVARGLKACQLVFD